jgi:hypothetical protein
VRVFLVTIFVLYGETFDSMSCMGDVPCLVWVPNRVFVGWSCLLRCNFSPLSLALCKEVQDYFVGLVPPRLA